MKTFLYGYGSLINLKSASKALKRTLTKDEVITATLMGYERSWTIWDNVFSNELARQVRAVFLNIVALENASLNGILIEVSNEELDNYKFREKNYYCADVTGQIQLANEHPLPERQVFTFVGKKEYLTSPDDQDCFIPERYVEMVNEGINDLAEPFSSIFSATTRPGYFPFLPGTYSFVDARQESAR